MNHWNHAGKAFMMIYIILSVNNFIAATWMTAKESKMRQQQECFLTTNKNSGQSQFYCLVVSGNCLNIANGPILPIFLSPGSSRRSYSLQHIHCSGNRDNYITQTFKKLHYQRTLLWDQRGPRLKPWLRTNVACAGAVIFPDPVMASCFQSNLHLDTLSKNFLHGPPFIHPTVHSEGRMDGWMARQGVVMGLFPWMLLTNLCLSYVYYLPLIRSGS